MGLVNVFSSLALLPLIEERKGIIRRLLKKHPNISEAYLEERLKKKSTWAYKELVYLLRIGLRDGVHILEMKGSWAGAFGWPQFLPSSYWQFAVDGNQDNKIELNEPEDSIASIANYLKNKGWRRDLDEKNKKRILWSYNMSGFYVDAVFAVANRLSSQDAVDKRGRFSS